MSTLSARSETIAELFRMVRDRRLLIFIPLIFTLALMLLFVTVAEMPVLIPFFYAVF